MLEERINGIETTIIRITTTTATSVILTFMQRYMDVIDVRFDVVCQLGIPFYPMLGFLQNTTCCDQMLKFYGVFVNVITINRIKEEKQTLPN